ncbi:MAG: DUF3820 family protein [Nannocystaceae bacterium]|nr:DUF3820 family protein [Nannocystaceae bacterium]
MDVLNPDPKVLLELIRSKMPFGKYEGRPLSNIPEEYFIWFRERGYPPGKLGEQMAMMLEIKTHGLETLLWELERRLDPLGAEFK